MDFKDFKGDKQELVTRLACCVVAALILYYALDKFGPKLKFPLLEQYLPWLQENKVQAIAVAAAALFGLSLAVFPLEKEPLPPPDGPCCEGYAPVDAPEF